MALGDDVDIPGDIELGAAAFRASRPATGSVPYRFTIGSGGEPDGFDAGLIDRARLRTRSGETYGADLPAARTMVIPDLMVRAPNVEDDDDPESTLRAVMATPWPLPMVWLGYGWRQKVFRWVTPLLASNPWSKDQQATGITRFRIEVDAGDPRVYGLTPFTDTLGEGDALAVPNPGTGTAPFTAAIPGPASDIRIRRADDLDRWMLRWPDLTVPSGKTLMVDTRIRVAMLDGVDHWGAATRDDQTTHPEPWGIRPGGDTLSVGFDTGDPTVTITCHPTWR